VNDGMVELDCAVPDLIRARVTGGHICSRRTIIAPERRKYALRLPTHPRTTTRARDGIPPPVIGMKGRVFLDEDAWVRWAPRSHCRVPNVRFLFAFVDE